MNQGQTGNTSDDATKLGRSVFDPLTAISLGKTMYLLHKDRHLREPTEQLVSSRAVKKPGFLLGKYLVAPHLNRTRRRLSMASLVPLNYSLTSTFQTSRSRTISASHPAKFIWGIWYDVLILYSICTTAYYLAFEHPGAGMIILDIFVWVMFLIDIPLSFFSQYEDDDGKIVRDVKKIAKRYATTWLVPDVVSLIPYSFFGYPEIEYYHRMIRILRFSDTLNFVDGTGIGAIFILLFPRLGDLRIAGYKVTYFHVSQILQRTSKSIFFSYFLACLFYWFAKHTREADTSPNLWFGSASGTTAIPIDMELMHGGEKLMYTWYFMLTTLATIGYGDVRPQNGYEQLFMVFILLFGIANYSIVMGNFISLVSDIIEINSKTDAIGEVSAWMDALESSGHFIPSCVKMQIIRHFNHYRANDRLGSIALRWWTADSIEELIKPRDSMFKLLPLAIKYEILDTMFGDVFHKYDKFFGGKTSDLRYVLSLHFQPRTFEFGEVILQPDEEPAEIFLLVNGSVGVSTKMNGASHTFMTCKDRMIIGDYEALGHTGNRFTYTALSRRYTEILSLPTKPFLDILTERYPKTKKDLFVRAAVSMHLANKLLGSYMDEKRPAVKAKIRSDGVKVMFLHVVSITHETSATAYIRLKSTNKETVQYIEEKFDKARRIVHGMTAPLEFIKTRIQPKGSEEK